MSTCGFGVTCENLAGSYRCGCPAGSVSLPGGAGCAAVKQCARNDDCPGNAFCSPSKERLPNVISISFYFFSLSSFISHYIYNAFLFYFFFLISLFLSQCSPIYLSQSVSLSCISPIDSLFIAFILLCTFLSLFLSFYA